MAGEPWSGTWRHSLLLKLVVMVLCIEAAALVLIVANNARLLGQLTQQETAHDFSTIKPMLNLLLSDKVFNRDYVALRATLQQIMEDPGYGIAYIQVFDAWEESLHSQGDLRPSLSAPVGGAESAARHSIYDISLPLSLGGAYVGNVQVGLSNLRLQVIQDEILAQSVWLALLGVNLSILIIGLAAYLLSRRLRELLKGARQVAAGDYSVRLAVVSRDEVGALAQCFNEMTAAVSQRAEILTRNEARFHAIADYTYAWESWFSPQLALLWVNPSVERVTGYDVAACLGMADYPAPILDPESCARFRAECAQILNSACGSREFEARCTHRAGHSLWCLVVLYPIYDDAGRSLGVRSSMLDISERKQTELALLTSEAQFRTVTETSSVGIYLADADGQYTYVNPMWSLHAGLSLYQAQGSGWVQGVYPQDRAELLAWWQQVLQNHHGSQYEFRFYNPRTHQATWISGTVTPLKDEQGGVSGYLGVNVDITSRKQAETALLEANRFTSEIISSAGEGIVVYDREFRCLVWNRAMAALTGCGPEHALGKRLFSLFPEVHEKTISKLLSRALQGETVHSDDLPYQTRDKNGWVWASFSPNRNRDGEVVGVIGIVNDITPRKQMESNLQRWANIFRYAAWGVAVTDANRKLELINPRYAQMHGYEVEELSGKPVGTTLAAEKQPELDYYQHQALENGHYDFESVHQRRDGSRFPVRVGLSAVTDEHGKLAYFVINIQDISKEKHAEEALRRAHEELENTVAARTRELQHANLKLQKLAKMKDEFLANVSHELRSPLNTILMSTEILNDQLEARCTPKQLKFILHIEDSARHLLALINDILDVAKVESGKLELEMERADLEGVCQSCVNLVKQTALKKRIRLSTQYDPAVRAVQVDVRRLKQILINLLSNAIKFTPERGEVGLEYHGDAEAQQVSLVVWDNGIGIPREMQEQLFQPFVQVESNLARTFEGTGLGLALVKNLTDMHGGSVHLESAPNQGSRFSVVLPWQPGTRPPGPDDHHCAEDEVPPTVPAARGARILVVDDSEANLETVETYLESKGFQVETATSGVQAIQSVGRAPPALVLMDIQMPEMDGLEAIRRLRADPASAGIPIIALTALAMPGDEERCLAAGADAYLSKPVSMSGLVGTVNGLLNRGG